MQVKLEFATYFVSMLGTDSICIDLPDGADLGTAVDTWLDSTPEAREVLKKRQVFLAGKLRAIYLIDGIAADRSRILADGDEVRVMKAFIGG